MMSRVLGDTVYNEAVRQKTHKDGIVHSMTLNIAHFVSTLRSIALNILMLDVGMLVSVRQVLVVARKAVWPGVRLLIYFGAGLLFTLTYTNMHHNISVENTPVSYGENLKSIGKEVFGISANSRPEISALEQELALLRTRTLGLDMTVRRLVRILLKSNFGTVICAGQQQVVTAYFVTTDIFYGKTCALSLDEELPDFASEAAGGSVISTPDTETYFKSRESDFTIFGIPLWRANYFTPRKVIQSWTQAGECWAFLGSEGKIEIELAYAALISHVTMEHIPVSASLTGIIDSAPKEFSLQGKFQEKFVRIDGFKYNIDGLSSQTFPVRNGVRNVPFKRVMLVIHSNWGNPDYTCIYRFKVHGKIFKNFDPKKIRL